MAKIIGWHADTSACYTRGCKLMATSATADQIEAAAFAAECAAQAGAAKLPAEPAPTYTDPDEQAWWVELRAHHRTVTIGGREFTLAPKGKSGVYCFDCNTYLPVGSLSGASAAPVTCPGCGAACKSGLTGISIRHDQRQLLDAAAVTSTRWYHTSSQPNWGAADAKGMVHLGTRRAALDRVADRDHYDRQVYLYEVEFEPATPVSERLYEEDQFDPTQGNFAADHVRDGANRYLNYYEDPGSISLYASRGAFRIVSATPVSLSE